MLEHRRLACLILTLAVLAAACGSRAPSSTFSLQQSTPSPSSTPQVPTLTPSFAPSPTTISGSPIPGAIPTPQMIYEIGLGIAGAAAWSPDGNTLAVGGSFGIYLYDAHTYREISRLSGISAQSGLTFSPDGRLFVAEVIGDIQLVDARTGEVLPGLALSEEGYNTSPVFYSGGKGLAYLSTNCPPGACLTEVKLVDLSTRQTLGTLTPPEGAGFPRHWGTYRSLVASPDGSLLAAAGDDGYIWVWEIERQRFHYLLQGHQDRIEDLSFSPDGELLASVSRDATARLWDVRSGNLVRTIRSFGDSLFWLSFTPSGELWVGEDKVGLWLYDLSGRVLAGPISVFGPYSIKDLRLNPAGTRLAEPLRNEVRIWNLPEGTLDHSLEGFNRLWKISTSPSGVRFTTQPDFGQSGTIDVYDTLSGELLYTISEHTANIEGLAYSRDERLVASWDADNNLLVWELASGRVVDRLHLDDKLLAVAFHPDGDSLAIAIPGEIRLWRPGETAPSRTVWTPAPDVINLSFSPDGTRLYFNREEQPDLYAYDVETGELLGIYKTGYWSNFQGFHPAGGSIAWLLAWRDESNPLDRLLRWNLGTGQTETILSGDFSTDYGPHILLSPDERLAYLSFIQPHFWDVVSGSPLAVDAKLDENTQVMGFGPGGETMLVATSSGSLQLWDISAITRSVEKLKAPARPVLPSPEFEARLKFVEPEIVSPGSGELQPGVITAGNVSDLVERIQTGPGRAADIAWLPDGSAFAVAGQDGVRLYDPDTLQEIGSAGPQIAVERIVFSPNSRYLAAQTAAGLEIWETSSPEATPEHVGTITSHPDAIGFLPPGDRLLLSNQESLLLWDIPTWREVSSRPYGAPGNIYALQPDLGLLARLYYYEFRFWDLSTWYVTDTFRWISDSHVNLNTFSLSPDRSLAAAGDVGGSLHVWRLPGGEPVETVTIVEPGPWKEQTSSFVYRSIIDLQFSPDSHRLAIAAEDHNVYLRDLSTSRTVALAGHTAAVSAVRFSPDGSRLLTLDENSVIRLWEVPAGRPLAVLDRYRGGFSGLLPLPNGDLLAWNGDRLWSGAPLGKLGKPLILPDTVRAVSSGGRYAALYGSNWEVIQVYDLSKKAIKATFSLDLPAQSQPAGSQSIPIANIAISREHLAASGLLGFWLWDLNTGALVTSTASVDSRYTPNLLGFNSDGSLLAVEMNRGDLTMVDSHTGEVQGTLASVGSSFRSGLTFSPSGKRIAEFGFVQLSVLDLLSSSLLNKIEIPYRAQGYIGRSTASLAYSPAGDLLAQAGGDGKLYLWDPNNLDLLAVLEATGARCTRVAFSTDGLSLLAGCNDGLVHAFELSLPHK